MHVCIDGLIEMQMDEISCRHVGFPEFPLCFPPSARYSRGEFKCVTFSSSQRGKKRDKMDTPFALSRVELYPPRDPLVYVHAPAS